MFIKYSLWKTEIENVHIQMYNDTNTVVVYIMNIFRAYITTERFSHFDQKLFIKFSIHFQQSYIPSRKLDISLHKFREY